jgi:hypothetical protein
MLAFHHPNVHIRTLPAIAFSCGGNRSGLSSETCAGFLLIRFILEAGIYHEKVLRLPVSHV